MKCYSQYCKSSWCPLGGLVNCITAGLIRELDVPIELELKLKLKNKSIDSISLYGHGGILIGEIDSHALVIRYFANNGLPTHRTHINVPACFTLIEDLWFDDAFYVYNHNITIEEIT